MDQVEPAAELVGELDRAEGGLDLGALRAAWCRRVYIDGSFVTSKTEPADFDGCWELPGTNLALLDPVFRSPDLERAAQKIKFRGELFPVDPADPRRARMLAYFQWDRDTHRPKGILTLNLETLP